MSDPVGLWGLLSQLCDEERMTWVEWLLVDEDGWVVEEHQERWC